MNSNRIAPSIYVSMVISLFLLFLTGNVFATTADSTSFYRQVSNPQTINVQKGYYSANNYRAVPVKTGSIINASVPNSPLLPPGLNFKTQNQPRAVYVKTFNSPRNNSNYCDSQSSLYTFVQNTTYSYSGRIDVESSIIANPKCFLREAKIFGGDCLVPGKWADDDIFLAFLARNAVTFLSKNFDNLPGVKQILQAMVAGSSWRPRVENMAILPSTYDVTCWRQLPQVTWQ